jgi:hypothetical protein
MNALPALITSAGVLSLSDDLYFLFFAIVLVMDLLYVFLSA